MTRSELLELLFLPFAVALNFKLLAAAALLLAIVWLVANRFLRLGALPGASLALWWFILGIAAASAMLAGALFLLAPYGPERYRAFIAMFVVGPLAVAALIAFFCKPVA